MQYYCDTCPYYDSMKKKNETKNKQINLSQEHPQLDAFK